MVDDATVEGQDGAEPGAGQPASAAVDPAQLAAFEALVAANHDDMARVAFVVTEGPGPAQDAARSAWVRAWRGLSSPTPPPQERQRDWLLGLAAAEARLLAEGGYRPGQDAAEDSGVVATQASAARAYKSDELELSNALAALDAHDRMIVGLRYVGGLDAEAIGRELSIPERAVLARIARILKTLVGEQRLAGMPSETVADYEAALAQRIRSLTGRALVPLDPGEVARTAIDTAPEPTGIDQLEVQLRNLLDRARALDRRIWLAVAGIALFVVIVPRLVGLVANPGATPIPSDASRLCAAADLKAHVTDWAAIDGDRIGQVELQNVSPGACLIDSSSEPWLVDHNRAPLLVGKDLASPSIRVGPGDTMRTQVQVHDYCGPTPPGPVTLAFRDGTLFIVADPISGDPTSGVPDCAGGTHGTIEMQPWRLAH